MECTLVDLDIKQLCLLSSEFDLLLSTCHNKWSLVSNFFTRAILIVSFSSILSFDASTMPVNSLVLKLDRQRRIYQQGEYIRGHVTIENKYELKHDGLLISLKGLIDLNFNYKNVDFMNTFQGTNKTYTILDRYREILPPGKLLPGLKKIPFEIPLDPDDKMQPILYETYQGVFISIQYDIRACLRRSLFYRDLIDSVEFYVEYDLDPIGATELKPKPVKFVITPYSLTAIRYDIIPNFKIVGQLDSSINLLNEPIRGHFVIENCDAVIRSVELQLVRVETCARNDNIDDSETVDSRNHCRDATEVQNIQIGDGNLLRKIPIDIYMVLPRLFTCPTLITKNFKVEFELNLVIIFDDNHLLTENFPIKLIRSTLQPIDFEG